MALKKSVSTRFGFDVADAYHRVGLIRIENKTTLSFALLVSKDETAESFEQREFVCEYDVSGENPMTQAYTYLKSLAEFSNAIDC